MSNRTLEQNKRLNAMCGDVAEQVRLDESTGRYVNVSECPNGRALCKDDFRHIFVGTFKGWRAVPALEGAGFIMLGASSRLLTIEECGEVMELIAAFAADRDVQFSDPQEAALRAAHEQEAA